MKNLNSCTVARGGARLVRLLDSRVQLLFVVISGTLEMAADIADSACVVQCR